VVKQSAVIALIVLVLLMATGFAAIQPQSNPIQDGRGDLQDAHFRYYEQLRPVLLLTLDYEALNAACDYGDDPAVGAAGSAKSHQSAATAYRERGVVQE
jgi:hypothetical protein